MGYGHGSNYLIYVAFAIVSLVIFLFLTPFLSGSSMKIVGYGSLLIFLVASLISINGVDLGRSDLGVWAMIIFGFFLFALSVGVFFGGAFISPRDVIYNSTFAIILFFLALFCLFRGKRRRGIFVYQG